MKCEKKQTPLLLNSKKMTPHSKASIITTADGSHTLALTTADETYHSKHGAITESAHIFIKEGLHQKTQNSTICILEVGFGTGLNALMTLLHSGNQEINYHALEPNPLCIDVVQELNYTQLLKANKQIFLQMHQAAPEEKTAIAKNFSFTLFKKGIAFFEAPASFYDLIYFDLFDPQLTQELWTPDIFSKLYRASRPGAIMTTYSVKGAVRRSMSLAGFKVEKLPGPPGGKREMTRAIKL